MEIASEASSGTVLLLSAVLGTIGGEQDRRWMGGRDLPSSSRKLQITLHPGRRRRARGAGTRREGGSSLARRPASGAGAPAGAGAGRGARRPDLDGSTIWRGGTARPLGGKRVRWAEPVDGLGPGVQRDRGGLKPALPEQQPQRVGVLSWGPQHLRGLKLGVEEQGGVGPAVQEEGGVGLGVQERGGRGHEPSLGVVWGPPDGADWRRPPRWTGSASWPVVQEEGLGPRKQHQEKWGDSPAVQERGEARAGVQERGEGSPRRLLQQSEQLPEFGDGSRERREELESSQGQGERNWESCGHPGREAVVLGAAPTRRVRPEVVGRARPVGPQGPEGEGRLGVQEVNWLPGVQEGQVVRAVQETYLEEKRTQEREGPPEEHRIRRRRRRRRW
ncbi:uncharacterized protein LOC143647599 [Tamandua tetradactyla]|uniref:uncharacterized protein LOC143647599 n=1 Tax=Tamandua tetradactyla TaxID=48850 RepID=UPI0040539358